VIFGVQMPNFSPNLFELGVFTKPLILLVHIDSQLFHSNVFSAKVGRWLGGRKNGAFPGAGILVSPNAGKGTTHLNPLDFRKGWAVVGRLGGISCALFHPIRLSEWQRYFILIFEMLDQMI